MQINISARLQKKTYDFFVFERPFHFAFGDLRRVMERRRAVLVDVVDVVDGHFRSLTLLHEVDEVPDDVRPAPATRQVEGRLAVLEGKKVRLTRDQLNILH